MANVYASEDTYTVSSEDYPHEGTDVMMVGDSSSLTAHIYIKFDLSNWIGKQLDPDSGGLLKLYIVSNEIPGGDKTRLQFRRIIETWDASTLRWGYAPDTTTTNDKSKRIYASADGWETYNITELLQDILDGEGCCGVYVEIDEHVVWFSTLEGVRSPKLVLNEAIPEGDILSGNVLPTSASPGESVDVAVDIKNIGNVGGRFQLSYYEGTTHLKTASSAWIDPGQTIDDVAEVFTMPNRDFTVTVKMYNEATEAIDDTYDVTCYLISGTEYYVKTNGNDELSGYSWANAWETIDKAARTVPDGANVHIGFGDYNSEPANNVIAPQNIAELGISYIPETAGGVGGTGTVTVEKN